MFSRVLAESLNGLGERPWDELKRGKSINPLWLSKRFHSYDVRPRTIWIGEMHAKGYLLNDFEVLFSRYIPRSEVEALLAETGAQRADPPSDSGAGSPPSWDCAPTNDGEQKKDEPGEAQGGEAAAA